MKKMVWTVCAVIMIALSGCGVNTNMSDEPMIFERGETQEYAYLSIDDKIYVPYCPFDKKYLGDCIGYCELQGDEYTDGGKAYIYELKGYSPDEWIIELDAEGGKEGMVLREINTTNIPENMQSEYEWNH